MRSRNVPRQGLRDMHHPVIVSKVNCASFHPLTPCLNPLHDLEPHILVEYFLPVYLASLNVQQPAPTANRKTPTIVLTTACLIVIAAVTPLQH